ncbi:MAG: hypothetical protein IJX17_04090 [Clostridia bacterium]|nr:hypothetical protein [Clostridia bacterium]
MATSAKKKKIQRMEMEDSLGISRKKWDKTFPPNLFIAFKITLIALIVLCYFIYSPLLFVFMTLYALLFFLARLSERSMNKSIIRKNHIKIPKFDSAIALLIVVVAIFGTFVSATKKTKSGMFNNFNSSQIEKLFEKKPIESEEVGEETESSFPGGRFPNFNQGGGSGETETEFEPLDFKSIRRKSSFNNIKSYFINLGSLLTGERNVFSTDDFGNNKFNMGMVKPPEDFIADKSQLPKFEGKDMNFNGGDFKRPMMDFSIDNIPLEYTFSSVLSACSTFLIFSVIFIGLISVMQIHFKRKNFNKVMTDIIVEGKILLLDEKELDRILSFGEEVETKIEEKKEPEKETKPNNKIESF